MKSVIHLLEMWGKASGKCYSVFVGGLTSAVWSWRTRFTASTSRCSPRRRLWLSMSSSRYIQGMPCSEGWVISRTCCLLRWTSVMAELNHHRCFFILCHHCSLSSDCFCRLRLWRLQTTASAGQVWWSQWGRSWSAAFPTSAGRTGIRLWRAPASVTSSRVQPKLWLGCINSRCLPGLCEAEGFLFCPDWWLSLGPHGPHHFFLKPPPNLCLLNDHQISNQYSWSRC